jgi:hypothetical protein
MSNWWSVEFAAVGDLDRISDLAKTLADRFHGVEELQFSGFLRVHAIKNYGGSDAVEQMIADYPELMFLGSVLTDMQYDTFYGFTGVDGETLWRTHEVANGVDIEEIEATPPAAEPSAPPTASIGVVMEIAEQIKARQRQQQ